MLAFKVYEIDPREVENSPGKGRFSIIFCVCFQDIMFAFLLTGRRGPASLTQ